MKNKLKAIQILEIMLDKDLNDRKVLDRSDGAVCNGKEWLHIDEALAELKEFIEEGVIRMENKKIVILNMAALASYTDRIFCHA